MKHSKKLEKRLQARIRAWEAAKERQPANWVHANKKPGSVQQK